MLHIVPIVFPAAVGRRKVGYLTEELWSLSPAALHLDGSLQLVLLVLSYTSFPLLPVVSDPVLSCCVGTFLMDSMRIPR